MIELENFQEYLKTIKLNDWNKLFDLIEIIEKTKNFGELVFPENLKENEFGLPYWIANEIVEKFLEVVYELNLIIVFNWTKWKEGAEILNNKEQNFENYDIITLCKLITAIVRSDRFCDGNLVGNFENKNIEKILRALKNKLENNI